MRTQDTTRPVTLAADFPELSSHIGFFDALDVVGYNYKEHLYEEATNVSRQAILGSENGGGYEQWCAVRDNAYISGQFCGQELIILERHMDGRFMVHQLV